MKIKHAILLIAIGYCLDIFGALQKIMHTYYADAILTAAAFIKIQGIIILLYKLFRYPKAKDFLNW